jgi:uncharacterized delta-60 repeat protein
MNIKKYLHLALIPFINTGVVLGGSPGALDTSYGPNNSGISTVAVGRSNALVHIAAQTDDSLVGVGTVTVLATVSGICRYTAKGILDPSFNFTGYEPFVVGSQTNLQCIAIQPDTNAVVGGYTTMKGITQFLVARFTMNGSIDTSFGGGAGYVTTDIGGSSQATALIMQPDGKIVAGGIGGEGAPEFALVRYNPDGSVDDTFGNQGIVRVNPGYVSSINALALQSDGKIVAAGYAWNLQTDVCAVVRFNTDGSLDETFGTNGIITQTVGTRSRLQAIIIQQDGNIVVGGYTTNDNLHYSGLLLRYDINGNLDPKFNNNGMVITTLNYSSVINALALQSNGNILAGGWDFGALATTFALTRYLPSGTIDSTFGTNGTVLTTVGSNAQINSMIIQSDGKIVVAGLTDNSAALARYFA